MNVQKAEKSFFKYQREQLRIIDVVCFLTLYRMGWDVDKIIDRFNKATDHGQVLPSLRGKNGR